MFKAIVLANLYQPGDQQLEFPTTDRLSFKRFLGLTDADQSPDEKTFRAFRERLTPHQLSDPLFDICHAARESKGMLARKGQRVEATFVEVPRQRTSREANAKSKAGEVPGEWRDQPEKARQQEVAARWTMKNGQRHSGYKNHVKVDRQSKLIEDYPVTAASVHESQVRDERSAEGEPTTYSERADTGAKCAQMFSERKVSAKPRERADQRKPAKEPPGALEDQSPGGAGVRDDADEQEVRVAAWPWVGEKPGGDCPDQPGR